MRFSARGIRVFLPAVLLVSLGAGGLFLSTTAVTASAQTQSLVVNFEVQGDAGARALDVCRDTWARRHEHFMSELLPQGFVARPVTCLLLESAEFDRLFGRRIPDWGIGVALAGGSAIALDCQRETGPDLGVVFLHEMAHALLYQVAGDIHLPTWFHEGVAQTMSGEWRFVDTMSVVLNGTLPSLNNLQGAFPGPGPWAVQAYRASLLGVSSLKEWYGEDILERLLFAVVAEENFDRGFLRATGASTDDFALRFDRTMRMRYGWLVMMTRWPGLFTLMAVLFAVGAVGRIVRNRRRLAEMEDEEDSL